MDTLVRAIRKIAKEIGHTELAQRLGVSRSMVAMIVYGHRKPGIAVLRGMWNCPETHQAALFFLNNGVTEKNADVTE